MVPRGLLGLAEEDPMTLKELRERRAAIVAVMVQLRDKANDPDQAWSSDDERRWNEASEDLARIDRSIRCVEATEEAERRQTEMADRLRADDFSRAGDGARQDADSIDSGDGLRGRALRGRLTAQEECLALQGWMLAQRGRPIRQEHRSAIRALGFEPAAAEIEIPLMGGSYRHLRSRLQRELESRASTAATDGGEMIAESFSGQLELAMIAAGGVRARAQVLRTRTGAPLPWPTIDDTPNSGRLVAEEAAVTETDIVTGEVVLNAFKYSSDAVLVSAELLEDSEFNLATVVADILGERLARRSNNVLTLGTGTGQPRGIVVASTVGVTAASATAITALEVIDLVHSVNRRGRARAAFMMHDQVLRVLRRLVDSQNRPLWEPNIQAGVPETLYGYPIEINDDMVSTLAINGRSILFGDLSAYKVREVGSIRFRRLQERYADTDREGFLAFWRGDGDLVDPGAYRVRHLQQAAA